MVLKKDAKEFKIVFGQEVSLPWTSRDCIWVDLTFAPIADLITLHFPELLLFSTIK